MTKTLAELIDKAYGIKIYLSVPTYEMNHYKDGSFVDFHIDKIVNLPKLIELAGGLELKMFGGEGKITVRLFERDVE